MTYKGYTGALEVDEDAGELFGVVLGLRDVVTFVGETVEEARKSFEESVDAYLLSCEESGKAPDKPFSGRFPIRIPAETHRDLAMLAHARKASVNDLVVESLGQYVEGHRPRDLRADPGEMSDEPLQAVGGARP